MSLSHSCNLSGLSSTIQSTPSPSVRTSYVSVLPPSTARARRPGPFPRMDELALRRPLLLRLSATLFDRDRAFVDSDIGVFHDSSGAAAMDAMGRPMGRERDEGRICTRRRKRTHDNQMFDSFLRVRLGGLLARLPRRPHNLRKVFCRLMIIRRRRRRRWRQRRH